MTSTTITLILLISAAALMAVYYLRGKGRMRTLFSGSLSGLSALFLLEFFGKNFGADLPLNPFNVCGSALLGVPFAICMTLLKIL